MTISSFSKSTINTILWTILAIGVLLRLFRITCNEFLFYDEGMYLGYNRSFLDLVAANPPHDLHEMWIILGLMLKTALTTAKALWFFILNLRVFSLGTEAWYFARIVSMVAGLMTVALTYGWAKRYYKSNETAFLSAVILCILPSHLFYSRLGMQESLSTLFFLLGMYLYVFAKKGISARSLMAAVFLAAVFFTNYRMLIAPAYILTAEFWLSRAKGERFDLQRSLSCLGLFALIVLGISSMYGGVNAHVTSAWIFHQAEESHAHRHLANFLSFPYYLFVQENFLFGFIFFSNLYLLWRKQFLGLLPFILVLLQMLIFSFAAEKGARYLCVVLPFAAMAVSNVLTRIKQEYPQYHKWIVVIVGAMLAGFLFKSVVLANARTDYDRSISYILKNDPQARIISTQPLVESLYAKEDGRIADCPKDFSRFMELVNQGYGYLIIDPQVYISWTSDQERFSHNLIPYLEEIRAKMKPLVIFPHIEGAFLTRFVLDHNQDLGTTLEFLNSSEGKGMIYVYDLHGQGLVN